MFEVGPGKLLLLAAVALIVFGPERLPQLAKDAAKMLQTLRELSTGVRGQLRELGPEFAPIAELRTLKPRTALTRAILGQDTDALTIPDPGAALRQALSGEEPAGPQASATLASPAQAGQPAAAPRGTGPGGEAARDSTFLDAT